MYYEYHHEEINIYSKDIVNTISFKIKPCPFCGSGKARLAIKNGPKRHSLKDGISTWQTVTYTVRCNICNARGGTASYDKGIGNSFYSKNEINEFLAKKAAVEKWNERTEGGDSDESTPVL